MKSAGAAKVLFVDDDEGNLVVCEAHCSTEFDILTARSAEVALELLKKDDRIGVIVADQRMPGATGVELLEQVRSEYPDVVRILITAYSDLSAAIAAINRGHVRRYLKKPWQPEELKAELKDALDVYDMSKKLRALDLRLREAERVYALGIIAAGVGHELRNPISWLHGSLQMIKTQAGSIEELLQESELQPRSQPLFQKIHSSIEHAEGAVNRVFDIVRGIAMPLSSNPPSSEVVDVREVLRLTLKLVGRELEDTATLQTELDGYPTVRGNATKVSQILLNLVVNALQALGHRPPQENAIRIGLKIEGPWVVVRVGDNGSGVPVSERDKIFDPFYTTKIEGGTGLGLAICRSIAEELGGSLIVDRDETLGGAMFELKLPSSLRSV